MEIALWALLFFAACLAVGASVFAFSINRRIKGRHVKRRAFAEHVAWLAPHVRIRTPFGPGPFPAVILLHGCGAVRQIMGFYSEAALSVGVAPVVVDSMTPRDFDYARAVQEVCKGRKLWGRERAADLYAALEIVRADPRLDPTRIALAGWSHGAWAILDALVLCGHKGPGRLPDGLKEAPASPFDGVQGAFLVYPFVSFPALVRGHNWRAKVPIESVLVEGDTVANDKITERVFTRARQAGLPVVWERISGVTHGFEEPDLHPESPLRYDREAAAANRARFIDFLERRLEAAPLPKTKPTPLAAG